MANRYFVRVACLTVLAMGSSALGAPPSPRVPWTTSRVVGSPDPAPPYQLERIYPKLTFAHPLDMAFAPGSSRRFVAEQGGKIYSFPDVDSGEKPDVFFDAAQIHGLNKVPGCEGIDSVYGFTFHPKFAENHAVFVCYLLRMKAGGDKSKGLRVSRFLVKGGEKDPPRCDMESETILLEYWGAGHCSGCLKFGPDGMLYIGTGDGADPTPPDPFDTGQNIGDLLSSILRIDVDHAEGDKPYSIPKDNPFVHTPGARGEVWAYGLRNPWRFSFDRATGELWAGDVGWETCEMVYRIQRGGNYGWSITEGPGSVHPDGKRGPTPILPPTLYLSHAEGASVTGGFVYHGKKLPGLVGQYIFGDWETRRLWAAPLVEKGLGKHTLIAQTDQRIVVFGEDAGGELYVLDYEAGGMYRIVPQATETASAEFPKKLSETGLFASVEQNAPAAGVVPFAIRSEQWVDYSTSERWAAVPGTGTVAVKDGNPKFPANSVLTRTFSLEMEANKPATRRRIETQTLHFDGKRWNGYTYRWNEQQNDADLVGAAGDEAALRVTDTAAPGGVREQTWRFPSRAQCMTCHTSWTGYAIAFSPAQLKRDENVASLLDKSFSPTKRPLVDPHDKSADLNLRARSYLATNCAVCHRMGGGGSANIELSYDAEPAKTRAFGTIPTQGGFGIDNARVIAPGDSSRSVLFYRMSKLGSGHMPHAGCAEIDPRGLDLMQRWINSMPVEEGDKEIQKASLKDMLAVAALQDANPKDPAFAASVDRLLASPRVALWITEGLDVPGGLQPESRRMIITRGYASEKPEVRDLFARFVPAAQRIKTLGTSFKSEDVLRLTGDAARGQQVFSVVNGGLCAKCHRVGDEGVAFGPELTHVGSKYDRLQLLENIVEPSKVIAPEFTTYRVKTKKGEMQMGLMASRTDAQVVLKTGPGVEVRLTAEEVERVAPEATSMMPDGLLGGLTAQQAADLLEYLQSLK